MILSYLYHSIKPFFLFLLEFYFLLNYIKDQSDNNKEINIMFGEYKNQIEEIHKKLENLRSYL
ncbi:hypothetical protein GMMP15_1620017 [Candidatus Magnetomoraceae bacterium gMMP-15]